MEKLTSFCFDHPKTTVLLALLVTVISALAFPAMHIDTDPENMLEPTQSDRAFYAAVKQDFGLHDLIVVGIVDGEGIFRPEALERIDRATRQIVEIPGVIRESVVSISTTDNVKSEGGDLAVHPIMPEIPRTKEAMEILRRDIEENPLLRERVASVDGHALAIYVPILAKDQSFRIAREIRTILKRELLPGETSHLAGLPVAEDTFGNEMFVQMAVVAPIAFLGILLLVFYLFRQAAFLLPIGATALLSVIWTMGAMIASGQTVHIMSSMIPVFLMPIAILDNIHILSEYHERYRALQNRRRALLEAMRPLYRAMFFTSATTAVGFASLGLVHIPPVQVHGVFVAFGVIVAWVLTHTLVPALIALTPERAFRPITAAKTAWHDRLMERVLRGIGEFSFGRPWLAIGIGAAIAVVGVIGVQRIHINDNPVRWFRPGHPIRVADRTMNHYFGGTYMACLVAESGAPDGMHRPEVLGYLDRLERSLETTPLVGKTSSVSDIVRRLNFVLNDNDPAFDRIPASSEAIGEMLFLFQSSGQSDDLDHYVDRSSRRANVWVQMKGGDNREMQSVEDALTRFTRENPPPAGLTFRWSGLTYINKVWQDLMVFGMLKAVMGSFVVVLLLMIIEFRSLFLGLLSMIPLSTAILFSYGLVGWVGKDYDMPIAVCSSLSLGLAVDFAIHYLQRFRDHYRESRDLAETNRHMEGAPGRAIARNAIVISIGFMPLLISSLTPYATVAIFFAVLMILGCLATLFLLPAFLRIGGARFLRGGSA